MKGLNTMKKRVVTLFLLLAMILCVSASAAARWNQTAAVNPGLSVNNKTVGCSLVVIPDDNSSQVNITVKVYSPSGTLLGNWTAPSSKGYTTFYETYTSNSTLPSGTYKMTYSVTVSGNGATDYINDYVTYYKS